MVFIGLFGDRQCSRCHFSATSSTCSEGWWQRALQGGDPHGTPEIPKEGVLARDARHQEGGGWLSGVAAPVRAPGAAAAVAGGDGWPGTSGCFRCCCEASGNGAFRLKLGGGTLEIISPKMMRKGQSDAPDPRCHPERLHPEGQRCPRSWGDPVGGFWLEGNRVSCETGCPNLASSFRRFPSPFSWLRGQRDPQGDGDTHPNHVP